MIFLACFITYLSMIGFIGVKSNDFWHKKCRYASDARAMRNVSAACWPIFLPIGAGMLIGAAGSGPSRVEKRREKELEEAKHQAQLAKFRYEEDIYLNKQLAGR